jgi:hypothetical protein
MVTFPNRVLFVGLGAVARCTLPILIKHLNIDPKHITILDFEPNDAALKPWIEQGMTFVRSRSSLTASPAPPPTVSLNQSRRLIDVKPCVLGPRSI